MMLVLFIVFLILKHFRIIIDNWLIILFNILFFPFKTNKRTKKKKKQKKKKKKKEYTKRNILYYILNESFNLFLKCYSIKF